MVKQIEKISKIYPLKKVMICVARALCFLLIFALLLKGVSFLLEPKDNGIDSGYVNPNANGYLSLEQNTLDVMIIGNSDAYSGFSPMEMWNTGGFTSYVSGTGNQTVSEANKILNQVLKTQHPKVVILETDELYLSTASFDSVGDDLSSKLSYTFNVITYHNRWKCVKPAECIKPKKFKGTFASKGQLVSQKIVSCDNDDSYMKPCNESQNVSFLNSYNLRKLNKICKSNNIQLVLVQVPSKRSWNYKKHNGVAALAQSIGVPFIDMELLKKDIEFDWTIDSRDGGNHLNADGAAKVSSYVASWLCQKYNLSDKRNDASYSSWNDDFNNYSKNRSVAKI